MKNDMNDPYISIHNQMAKDNGMNAKALWGSEESQKIRFNTLKNLFLTNNGFTVVDFGCGLAHFYDYLIEEGFYNVKYVGVDFNISFVNEIKKQKPNIQVEHGGSEKVIEILNRGDVDYVVSSGIYNLGESVEVVQSKYLNEYSTFFDSVKVGCGANFLSELSDKQDELSIYHNPYELLLKCEKSISKYMKYYHNYLPHDFTILNYKKLC